MKKLFSVLIASLLTTFLLAVPALAGEYSSDFEDFLNRNQDKEMIGAIITMANQVDLGALKAELYTRNADRREWHEAVVLALQEKATITQAGILAQLSDMAEMGMVEDYRGLWVGNVILITATPEALDILTSRDDVLQVNPDHPIETIKPVEIEDDEPLISSVEIGLERIRAHEVWAMGYTGEGRLVSHLDTGVDGNHPALSSRWRGLDPRYADNPEWAWFDPVTNTQFPFDASSHGTHTMGTITGMSETTGDTIGVAFGAQWMSAGVIDRVSIPQTVADALLSFEWLTDPDGDPSTVWDVPDACSNSWGLMTGHGYPPCDQTFWVVLDGCEAAGIIVVFAAGNEGPGANSLRRPADRATTELTSFSVGAVDGANPNLPIAGFSSRGPSYCTPEGDPTFKPEVSAPGVNVRSSMPGGGYGTMSGTSMACPHVAGVVALIRHANPNLTSDQVRQIMLDTAFDLGEEGEDNTYGMGVVDAYEAVIRALAYLEGWGTLAGLITDQASGLPIHGATISVEDRPWSATSRVDGWYYLFMPADTLFDIRVDFSPTHLPIFDQQEVDENETTYVNYALEGKVTVTLTASFANPEDVDYRSFYLDGSWDNDGFYDASWSVDLMAISDDGVAPDETAGDGVFTGEVMLARDETNTYSWAIYTEDYGGEDARIDDGADFDIPDLNPPTVPTLEVNPSGSDNNWIFSVEGDQGLSLDLMPGIDSNPNKWGATDSLYEGTTYTFLFHTMHSDVVTYGSGGVGGPALTFTAEVDGAYDFIFNDYDDSYIVQLAGTEGPPTYLSAQSGLDGHIPVGWLPPGTQESVEMAYDDGMLVNAYYYYAAENLMATMFVPESYPVSIDSVMIHVLTEGDPYWPWPDGNHDPIGISIYLDDGSGYPEADPVFYTTDTAELGDWVRTDVDEVIVTSGAFWVAMNNLSDSGPYDGLGLDAMTDYPANKWAREFGVWSPLDLFPGDHMIRCKVFGGGRSEWLGYDGALPAGEVSSRVARNGNPELVAGTGNVNEFSPATENPVPFDRTAYFPHILSEPGLITDTEVLAGYNLYRDISPSPFDRDLKINDELITETNYDDWGDDPYGPIVNGVLYYYQGSAVYDIGGGDFVEVGPSNEATGMAENHPPDAPEGLEGNADGDLVTLNWDPNTDYDIASYNIYRRDYNQSDFNLVGNVTHPTTTYSETIEADGIYRYKLKAVDNGDMESETFSSYVDVAVGLIPPGVLSASDDEEFKIELEWRNPGRRLQSDVQQLEIGVLHADYAGDEGEVVDYLIASGEVTSATFIDVRNSTPTLQEIEPFDMLLVWSNFPPADGYALGDVLADYVETGKGVVVLEFAFTINWGMNGRFINEYSPFGITPTGYMDVSLGDYDPGHPLMEGVESLTDYYVFDVPLQNNAEAVATWSNGWPAVAFNTDMPNVVCINGYIGQTYRQWTGNMLELILNSVLFVSGGSGIEPDGFILYKADDESGPFNVLATLPGTENEYDDAPVPNDIPYWYQVTAIWDADESDPSNTAMGIGENHNPPPPYNLEALAVGNDVTVTWEFDDDAGDLDHFNIFHKLMPDGEWLMVGTSDVNSYTDVIPSGEDGTYGFRATAVDDGDPQLESEPSNTAYALVGHVPPTSLVAISDQDASVPLRWNLPGSWIAGGVDNDDQIHRIKQTTKDIMKSDFRVLNTGEGLDLSHKGDPGTLNPPIILDQGGPDEFGYSWIDSDEPGGPTYEWRDITDVGVQIPITSDDQNLGPFELGFEFSFYGEVFETFNICSNGWLSFTSTLAVYWNQPIPNFDAPENLVAPFWDDLYPPNGGEFWYYTDGSECVVSFINVPHIGFGGPYTFQVIFRSTGSMIFQYEQMNPDLNSCTIGIQNGDYSIGLQVVYDADYIHSNMAIRIGTGPDGIPPVHYNLYRSETSPVPVDPDYLINNEIPGEETGYIDTDDVVNGTTYYYVMTSVWPDSIESPASNEASATPVEGGHLEADPTSLEAEAPTGGQVSVPLTLSNDGGLPVNFQISSSVSRVMSDVEGPYLNKSAPVKFQSYSHEYDKSDLPPEEENPPVIADQGGPDEFGYTWIDSDEPNGPTYDWIDITGYGNTVFMYDDENQGPFPMEFSFSFYDQLFSTFRICSNGWISFTSTSWEYWNEPIPGFLAPENLMAPFWDDLNPSQGGMIYWFSDEDMTVVSWVDVPYFGGGGPYTFQVILRPNGVITYQYQTMYNPINGSTVGIQDASQTIGLQIAYNSYYVHDELAIRICAGWLSADPSSGVVSAGGELEVDVLCDASLLEEGTYEGSLSIQGWDENQSLPEIVVPVTFIVGQVGITDSSIPMPTEFSLSQNYPNPFNAKTEIRYALPVDSDVKLEVFNVLGQKVATILDGKQKAGYHSITWNGTSSSGEPIATGLYMYKLVTSEKTFVKKMLMLK